MIIASCWAEFLPDSGRASSFGKSKIMMRMGLIVVGLGTLTVMELGTPSRTKTRATDPFHQLTIDVSVSPDTLDTAYRLAMPNGAPQAPAHPVAPIGTPTALP